MSSPHMSNNLSSPQRDEHLGLPTGVPTIKLDLSEFSPIFVSATHFESSELHEFEDELVGCKANLTYDASEARIFISKVVKKARIRFDLRAEGLSIEDVSIKPDECSTNESKVASSDVVPQKRKRELDLARGSFDNDVEIHDTITGSGEHNEAYRNPLQARQKDSNPNGLGAPSDCTNNIKQSNASIVNVVSVAWFKDSERLGQVQPLDPYIKFRGRRVEKASDAEDPERGIPGPLLERPAITSSPTTTPKLPAATQILARAKEDAPATGVRWDRFGRRKFGLNTPSANPASWEAGHGTSSQYVSLVRAASTEDGAGDTDDLPEMPDWVKQGLKYACQRVTPANSPNNVFISLLKQIKLARLLTNDEIGVRAYSTSIAAIAAYPHKIRYAGEILALPGCDSKIAKLFVEWTDTGKICAVEDIEADEDLRVLRLFYDIWGVGATTAREFYYDKGWNDLDDIVEHGWSVLSRVQQIGVKYYDEFQDLIPRAEVERIGQIVHEHAVRVRDEGIQTMIVGGYRRGKEASGDVDIIVSHPEEGRTLNIVNDIVASLEEEEWITHTLYLSLHNSNRGQATLPFRTGGGGHGFDTLDKALVVWQDPNWPTKEQDVADDSKAKNPNIHRRVDIIISPWRTVGCAVVGWSGGTTFERDLRRYAKHVHSWKFDSSGVRDRRNGEVVDMEGYFHWRGKQGIEARAKTMEEAERRVFESMGIPYRAPWERCTH